MTLSRKQLVAVAEFQFLFCYLALRMSLKLLGQKSEAPSSSFG
jgi:hypothetical protein